MQFYIFFKWRKWPSCFELNYNMELHFTYLHLSVLNNMRDCEILNVMCIKQNCMFCAEVDAFQWHDLKCDPLHWDVQQDVWGVLRCLWFMLIGVVMLMICGCRLYFHVVALHVHTQRRCVMLCSKNSLWVLNLETMWVGIHFFSPACSKATIIDCSIRSLSMNPRKSSRYMVRSGSWKVHRGVSRSGSLLLPPVLETWERARETMVELAWEMPLDRRFSVAATRQLQRMMRNCVIYNF